MEILRTPDECFRDLSGYDFTPHYAEISHTNSTLRVHYLDEGPATAAPILLLHGEPSWCYLYRKMIPILSAAGHRVVAPDLVGFGRSDKLAAREDYSYQFHVDTMTALIERLDLRDITLFCQDWGGLIGLRSAAEQPDRFARIVAANTFLPTGDQKPSEGFLRWQHYSQTVEHFHVGGIIKGGCVTELSPEVIAAYNAPFPDDRYKAGARQFPLLVPTRPDDPASEPNRRAWQVLKQWQKPFLTAFSDSDPVTRGADAILQKLIPGAAGQPHVTITGAGHFLQEDKGEELAQLVADFIARTAKQ
ncbi:MAG: haloalkane dehalogenase [Acidobacteria bacterium]|nr:haloalkane dehalogenase [Acidobacteriota bacterium]